MINFVAPVTEATSYGLVGKYILKGLSDKGLGPTLYPLGDHDNDDYIRAAIDRGSVFTPQPSIKLFHQFALEGLSDEALRIGFPIFELDRFNKQEQEQLKSVDMIFVCSNWAKEVVSQYMNEDLIYVVPLGVDTDVFKYAPSYYHYKTRFLCVGKWEYRKGHDILVKAFANAFSEWDDVELVMHCENIFIGPENRRWENLYKSKLGDRVQFTYKKDYPTHNMLSILYNSCNCLIAPSRAEGWGMPILEAMACGLSVITTNISGQSEYVSGENAYIIDTDGAEVAFDGRWFWPEKTEGGQWAKLDSNAMDSLVEHMRRAHAQRQSNPLYVNEAAIKTARNFTWKNTVNKLCDAVMI